MNGLQFRTLVYFKNYLNFLHGNKPWFIFIFYDFLRLLNSEEYFVLPRALWSWKEPLRMRIKYIFSINILLLTMRIVQVFVTSRHVVWLGFAHAFGL